MSAPRSSVANRFKIMIFIIGKYAYILNKINLDKDVLQSNLRPLPLCDFICLQLQGISSEARVFSMAFPKNYPFLVLTLFVCSLCVVPLLNYATCSTGNGNFMLYWTYSNNKLIFNKTCKATGYCAVGSTETATGRNIIGKCTIWLPAFWLVQ